MGVDWQEHLMGLMLGYLASGYAHVEILQKFPDL